MKREFDETLKHRVSMVEKVKKLVASLLVDLQKIMH
jgi:hypothetical protein